MFANTVIHLSCINDPYAIQYANAFLILHTQDIAWQFLFFVWFHFSGNHSLSVSVNSVSLSGLTSSAIASNAFTIGTAAVLPFYALMVVAPKAEVVRFLRLTLETKGVCDVTTCTNFIILPKWMIFCSTVHFGWNRCWKLEMEANCGFSIPIYYQWLVLTWFSGIRNGANENLYNAGKV